ncbi:divergent polysaccharide deacetylase family protein [Neobacillus mesonae]|nr:divergent polysaccharide deacetylase family protein [Neobacillus mesonae]
MSIRRQRRRQLKKKVLSSFKWGGLRIIAFSLVLGAGIMVPANASQADPMKKAAIIIDDLGNGMKGTEEIMSLPIKVTVAIMPFLPTTKKDAEFAHQKGIDVLIHMPMEPQRGRKDWLGPGAITSDLSDEEIRKRVEAAIDDVPHAIGMNNHMGSKITTDRRIMSIVLDVCKERGLFFVDSKTHHQSVVAELAIQKGLPPVVNDIFLDDRHTISHVTNQIKLAEKKLENQDTCVMIGHVGGGGLTTASAIQSSIPRWSGKIETISISEMVRQVWKWSPDTTLPTSNK